MTEKKSKTYELLRQSHWKAERKKLREILLGCGLDEDIKWGKLCYSYEGRNVVIIFGLTESCALGFFKGSLLGDETGLLVRPGKHSQAMRQMRFTSLEEITDCQAVVADYIEQAIQVERDGLEVEFAEKDDLSYPEELRNALDDDPDLAKAFEDLTPGRQRGYVIHFSDAKQSKTRASRIEKCRPRILKGKGLNER